jgi:RNA polymerase sigma factor (sigma-70 family)
MQHSPQSDFNHLYNTVFTPLCTFAARFVSHAEAEEIIGDAFVILYQRLDNFTDIKEMRAFVYTTTRNACINQYWKTKFQERVKKQLLPHWIERENLEPGEISETIKKHIQTILLELPSRCRKVIWLYYWEGKSFIEIAVIMHISVHTVRNQKVRGDHIIKTKLKALIRKNGRSS